MQPVFSLLLLLLSERLWRERSVCRAVCNVIPLVHEANNSGLVDKQLSNASRGQLDDNGFNFEIQCFIKNSESVKQDDRKRCKFKFPCGSCHYNESEVTAAFLSFI